MIFAIIIGAFIFGHFITETGVTDSIVGWVSALTVHPLVIVAFIMVFYLALGFFMDQAAIVALTVPIMLPVIETLGYDAVWFGVFVVLMGEIGLVTPPLGLNVFIVSKTARRPTEEVFRGSVPYVSAMLAVAALFVLVPDIVTWLPSTM
jgi:C4-dicarboxylate transporter, DctM subunit